MPLHRSAVELLLAVPPGNLAQPKCANPVWPVVTLSYPTAGLSVLIIVVITLSGCGGSDSSPAATASPAAPTTTSSSPAPPATFIASGDSWDFRVAGFEDGPIVLGTGGYNAGPRIAAFNGALDLSGTSVTAVLAVWGGCINDTQARFTGTRNGLELDMVAAPIKSVTLRVTGTLSTDMRGFSGTYTATGGACSTAAAEPITGQRVELDGVWSDSSLRMTIALATVPSDKGSFALTGTVVFANNPCFPDAVVSNAARGRLVFPDVKSGNNVYLFDGEVSRDFKQMRYRYFLGGGSCPANSSGDGTLLRK